MARTVVRFCGWPLAGKDRGWWVPGSRWMGAVGFEGWGWGFHCLAAWQGCVSMRVRLKPFGAWELSEVIGWQAKSLTLWGS